MLGDQETRIREEMSKVFVEIHLLQNFALSNLNRDDTGAPRAASLAHAARSHL